MFLLEVEKLFNDYIFSIVVVVNVVFNGEFQEFIDFKDEKYIIRLFCVIYVLKEVFSNVLGINELLGVSVVWIGIEGVSVVGVSVVWKGREGVSVIWISIIRVSVVVIDDQLFIFVILLLLMCGVIVVIKYFVEKRNIFLKVVSIINLKSIVCI